MSAATLFAQPFWTADDVFGNPLVGAQLFVYQTGTTTPVTVYTDSGLSVAWTQPIVTNSAGQSSGPIFVEPTPSLKLVALDANNVALSGYPCDPWTPYALA